MSRRQPRVQRHHAAGVLCQLRMRAFVLRHSQTLRHTLCSRYQAAFELHLSPHAFRQRASGKVVEICSAGDVEGHRGKVRVLLFAGPPHDLVRP